MPDYARSVIAKSLKSYKNNIALCVGATTITYQQLLTPAAEVLENTHELFVEHKAILVLSDKTIAGYQCIAAAFLSGKTYVPLNPKYTLERNAEIISQSSTRILFVDSSCQQQALEIMSHFNGEIEAFIFSEIQVEGAYERTAISHHKSTADYAGECVIVDDAAYLLFTSGSTGKPKGVSISDENLKAYLEGISSAYEFLPDDRFTQFFDFTFDLSIHDLLVSWAHGASLYAANMSALLMPLHFAKRNNITVWFSVPSLPLTAKDLLRDKFRQFRIPTLKYSFFCGEAFPQSLAHDWLEITDGAPVINLYGPTEATIAFTAHEYDDVSDNHYAVVPIGKPFGDNQVGIFNENGQKSDAGELCLSGPQVFSGYLNHVPPNENVFHLDKRAGSETFARSPHDWYRSGDVISEREDGVLLFHGRNDRQVQVKGFRVELQEVEHSLREFIDCGALAVIPYPVNEIGETEGLTVFIIGDRSDAEMLTLRQEAERALPFYMVPKFFYTLKAFPFNASGKVDFNELKKIASDLHAEGELK